MHLGPDLGDRIGTQGQSRIVRSEQDPKGICFCVSLSLFDRGPVPQIAWLKSIFFPFGCSTRVLKNCYLLPSCLILHNVLKHIMNSHLSFYILTFSSWKLITFSQKVTVNKITILYDEEAS